jgi:hypothetical protein
VSHRGPEVWTRTEHPAAQLKPLGDSSPENEAVPADGTKTNDHQSKGHEAPILPWGCSAFDIGHSCDVGAILTMRRGACCDEMWRLMMKRLLVAASMSLLVGATTSCGSDDQNRSQSSTHLPPMATSTVTPTLSPDQQALIAKKAQQPVWTPAPAGPGEIVYPGVGVRFTPTSGAAKLSASQALAVVTQRNLPIGPAAGTPIIQLARFTDGDFYSVNGAQVNTGTKNVLSWVFTYTNSTGNSMGPARLGASSGTVASANNCDFVAAVNATTGALLTSFQDCPGQVTARLTSH